ncbi:4Fe-4S binding protein [Clostridium estertheticum]|uniref:4Fe-4S binding protein n=1 Tax=Clostridium estertheticum TaxID=238834 RepID=UPI001CD12299|nr:4Fe-4S binding protein [Clostridium estertheticum]MBZ9688610.1 4Fe-4S binding protein [Clostridium estertheticum]
MILKGDFNFIHAFPKLIAALVILPIRIFLGRFFCGWFCAFGSFNDFLYIISSKVFKTKFKINKELDAIFKYLKYIVLVFIIYVLWTKGNALSDSTSPWDAFAQMTNFPEAIADYFIGFVLLGFITAGAIYIERFFCRYLCPLGAVFAIISKFRKIKIDKLTEKCGKCRLCTNSCAMGINLYKMDQVNSGECINCFKCVDVCPRANTKVIINEENIDPAFASSVAIVAFAGLYAVGSGTCNLISSNIKESGNSTSITNGRTANKGDSKTQNSASIPTDTEPHNNTNKTTPKANTTVPPVNIVSQKIIKAQSTNVDAVSGATRTSNGIMHAVDDALRKAMV